MYVNIIAILHAPNIEKIVHFGSEFGNELCFHLPPGGFIRKLLLRMCGSPARALKTQLLVQI